MRLEEKEELQIRNSMSKDHGQELSVIFFFLTGCAFYYSLSITQTKEK